MPFTHFDHLTDLDKETVNVVFRGWRREYLETLKFQKAEEGWRRDIPMDETVKTTLRETERVGDLLFQRKDGKPVCCVKVHHVFRDAVNASGIADFRFHDLRHTFASNLVMNGVKIEKVQKLIGHKMLTMTQKYSHLAPGYLSESVKVLDRIMSQNPPQVEKVVHLNP